MRKLSNYNYSKRKLSNNNYSKRKLSKYNYSKRKLSKYNYSKRKLSNNNYSKRKLSEYNYSKCMLSNYNNSKRKLSNYNYSKKKRNYYYSEKKNITVKKGNHIKKKETNYIYYIYSKYSDRQVWANSVDYDPTPHAASDHVLHCLLLNQQFSDTKHVGIRTCSNFRTSMVRS